MNNNNMNKNNNNGSDDGYININHNNSNSNSNRVHNYADIKKNSSNSNNNNNNYNQYNHYNNNNNNKKNNNNNCNKNNYSNSDNSNKPHYIHSDRILLINKISQLLGFELKALNEILKILNKDKLAEFLYEKLFYFIVGKINKELFPLHLSTSFSSPQPQLDNCDFENQFLSINIIESPGFEVIYH